MINLVCTRTGFRCYKAYRFKRWNI